jgi:DNA-binding NarL/FixJ family response regulator
MALLHRSRVLLVDMSPLLRDVVRSILGNSHAVEIVGEMDRSADVARVARRLCADVVICGIEGHESVIDADRLLRSPIARILTIRADGIGSLYRSELLRRDLGALSAEALVQAVTDTARHDRDATRRAGAPPSCSDQTPRRRGTRAWRRSRPGQE